MQERVALPANHADSVCAHSISPASSTLGTLTVGRVSTKSLATNRGNFLLLFLLLCYPLQDISPIERVEALWSYHMGGKLIGMPAWSPQEGGTLYFLSGDRHLYAVSGEGELLWRRYLPRAPVGPIGVGQDGTIYLALDSGVVFAVNSRGRLIWRVTIPTGEIVGIAISTTGSVYPVTDSGTLLCIDHLGRTRWKVELDSPPSGHPIYVEGWGLLVPRKDSGLSALSLGGQSVWASLLASPCHTLLPLEEGIITGSSVGTVALLDYTGEVVWNHGRTSPGEAPLLYDGITILHGAPQGGGVGYSMEGETISEFPGEVGRGIALIEGGSLVGGHPSRGTITIASVEGSVFYQLDAPFTEAVVTDQGLLFAGGEDWIIRAYPLPVTPGGAWSQEGGGTRRTYYGRGAKVRPVLPEIERNYLLELASSQEEYLKLMVLTQIQEGLEDGSYTGVEPAILSILHMLAGEGVANPIRMDGRLINDFPEVRRRAAALLGRWGDLRSSATLIRLLSSESSIQVALTQAEAIGRLGSDPSGRGTVAIATRAEVALRSGYGAVWGVVLPGILENILQYNGGYPDSAGFRLHTRLLGGDFGATARRRVLERKDG